MKHSDNILYVINQNYHKLTKGEKKVADYVTAHPKDILYTSITDLANMCNVGDTTVFRFCKTLELRGYQDFRMKLAQSLSLDNEADNAFVRDPNDNSHAESVQAVCQKQYTVNMAAINETYELLNHDAVDKAVSYLVQARNIYFFGVGSSAMVAMTAQNCFLRICSNVHCLHDNHLQSMVAALMSKDDVAVMISYSGSTKDTLEILQLAKGNGSKIISLTHFRNSPIAASSDVVLLSGSKEGPFQGGSTSASIAQLFLIDILYSEFYKRNYAVSQINKHKTSNAIAEKLL